MTKCLKLLFLAITALSPLAIYAQSKHTCGDEHERLSNLESAAVKKVTPYYPNDPGFHIRGKVIAKVKVDKRGNVVSTSVLCGPPLLYLWAVQAAKDWKFTPRMRKGRPVNMTGIIMLDFPAKRDS
jgi:hypothetical protein